MMLKVLNQHEKTKYEQFFVDSGSFLLTPGSYDLLCKYVIVADVIKALKCMFGDYASDGVTITLDGWAADNPDEVSLWLDMRKLSDQDRLDLGFILNSGERFE